MGVTNHLLTGVILQVHIPLGAWGTVDQSTGLEGLEDDVSGQISSRPHRTEKPPKCSKSEGKWDPLFQGDLGW